MVEITNAQRRAIAIGMLEKYAREVEAINREPRLDDRLSRDETYDRFDEHFRYYIKASEEKPSLVIRLKNTIISHGSPVASAGLVGLIVGAVNDNAVEVGTYCATYAAGLYTVKELVSYTWHNLIGGWAMRRWQRMVNIGANPRSSAVVLEVRDVEATAKNIILDRIRSFDPTDRYGLALSRILKSPFAGAIKYFLTALSLNAILPGDGPLSLKFAAAVGAAAEMGKEVAYSVHRMEGYRADYKFYKTNVGELKPDERTALIGGLVKRWYTIPEPLRPGRFSAAAIRHRRR